MAETSNIAVMARIISDSIFEHFRWEKAGPEDTNWECVLGDKHRRTHHPSDVVFRYKEPYKHMVTCLNTDLKSLGRESITTTSISNAIYNLDKSIECAKISGPWQSMYAPTDNSFDVCGLLFIYNHDNEYDKEFNITLMKCANKVQISKRNKIFIISPSDVLHLNTITNDMLNLRATDNEYKVPPKELCSFVYPTSSRFKHSFDPWSLPATIEMILSPWIIMQYKTEGENSSNYGIHIYIRSKGERREEFMYIFDYLCHYQLIHNAQKITINMTNGCQQAEAIYERAIEEYVQRREDGDYFIDRLQNVKIRRVTNVVAKFSDIAIGMSHD